MSVIVTVSTRGDAAKLEAYTAANPDAMKGVVDRATQHGLIAHRFYGADDGRIMVIDEWPDAGSFQTFFAEVAPQVQEIMGAAGATSEPEVTFWRKLETGDEVGWDV
jgi:quinol monooxygenase YgiN